MGLVQRMLSRGGYGVTRKFLIAMGGAVVLLFAVGVLWYIYFHCWFVVNSGQYMPLLKKEGTALASNLDVIQIDPEGQGPQLEVLGEGRYLRNAFNWWWPDRPMTQTVIPPDKVGVLIRKYGKPLPPGRVLATQPDEKGVVDTVLGPGSRNLINEWAYSVELHDLITIPAGVRGIVALLDGKDPENSKDFVVKAGERGTQPDLLKEGIHPEYSNPYKYKVIKFDCRSQKLETGAKAEVKFLSVDGFEITMKSTIEWSVILDLLPRTFAIWVEQEDLESSGGLVNIRDKLVLPAARSWARIHGSKHKAIAFIPGDTKIELQEEIFKFLKAECAQEGVEIRSFVLHDCDPDSRIREQYARREIARQEIVQFQMKIQTEVGSPAVDDAGQPRLDAGGKPLREGGRIAQMIEAQRKDREEKLGRVRSEVAQEIRKAEQYQAIVLLEAEQKLEVARQRLKAAQDQAAAVVADGVAKADVKVQLATARADGIKAKVAAFTTGDKYADNLLAQKVAPAIRQVFSNTDGPFVSLFERFASSQPAE